MKKLLCILLILSILCSVPVCATENGQKECVLSQGPQLDAPLTMDRIKDRAFSKRGAAEDNLIFPGPYVWNAAKDTYGKIYLNFGAHFTGKANQYYCMMIYKGSEPVGEPVATDFSNFYMPSGYGTVSLAWDKEYAPPGQYTVVSFTANLNGQTLEPIDDTASMAHFYLYDNPVYPERSFLINWETGESMEDKIRLAYGETTVLAAGRYPEVSTAGSSVSFACDFIQCAEAGGLFFVTPKEYGSDYFRFYYLHNWQEFPVEVCITDRGHSNIASYSAGTPTEDMLGYNLHICGRCGMMTTEKIPTLEDVFNKFQDIPADSWYLSDVREAVSLNLFKGVSETQFGPDRSMTRAMLVTVLWRYEGEPDSSSSNFTDVAPGAWYKDAVDWASEQEIVNGVGKGKFNPDGTITREQLATILYRYAQKKGMLTDITGDISPFPDGSSVSSWAETGLSWALGHGLINGVSKNGTIYLKPEGNATRAQVSAILVRFIDKLAAQAPSLPDLTDAVDGGIVNPYQSGSVRLHWGLYESDVLRFGIEGANGIYVNKEDLPWTEYADQIRKVEVLNSVELINASMFSDYPNLESVILAESVWLVDEFAFQNCPKLKEVHLSDNITFINRCAFEGCTAMEEIRLPKALTEMSYGIFRNCTSLQAVTFGSNIRKIGDSCFYNCTALEEIVLPDSIRGSADLGSSMFSYCTSLKKVVMPIGLEKVDGWMFYGCTSLQEVELPYAATEFGDSIFYNCSSLEQVVLPFFLKKMSSGQFVGCTSLKEVYALSTTLEIFYVGSGEALYPFGDPGRVTVYGIAGTDIQDLANKHGYTFCSITAN